MKGHLGAVMTSVLGAIAIALVLLQAVVAFHTATRPTPFVAPRAQSNRYSAPGGRSALPWGPGDKAAPGNREGRTPQQKEEHRSPAPPPGRGFPPQPGPRAPRKLSA